MNDGSGGWLEGEVTCELRYFVPVGSEDEGDGILISGVQVGDAGSLVFIARNMTPPQSSRPRVDQKPTVLLFYRDLNREG